MVHLNVYLNSVRSKVREAGSSSQFDMGNDDYTEFVNSGLRRYSRDRPDIKVSEITGTASSYIAVNGTNFPGFVEGFSKINYIESDGATIADNDHPHYLERNSWDYYRDTTNLYVYLKNIAPPATSTIRVQYTLEHTIEGLDSETIDTIPSYDFEAVVYWSAAEALLALAGKMADSIAPILRADVVNYGNKSTQYIKVSDKYRQLYMDWIHEDHVASSVTRDIPQGYSNSSNMPWQTHRSF